MSSHHPTTERLWETNRLTSLVYENSGDHVYGFQGDAQYMCTYIEQLVEETEQLKAELSRIEKEKEAYKNECSQVKKYLRSRYHLDEEMEASYEETILPLNLKRNSLQRTSFSSEDELEITKKLESLGAENEDLNERLSMLKTENDSLETQLEESKHQTAELSRRLRSAESLSDQLVSRENEILLLQKELSDQREKTTQLESRRRQSMNENVELESELESREDEIADLKKKLDEMTNGYFEYRTLLEEQKAANASLRHEQKPKVLRHISTHNSPYVSMQSVSSEIEESIRLRRKQRRYSENEIESSRVRNMISLVHLTSGLSARRRLYSESNSLLGRQSPSVGRGGDETPDGDQPQPELWLGSATTAPCEDSRVGEENGGHEDDDRETETRPRKISWVPLGCAGRPGSLDLEFALGLRIHLSPLQTGQLDELWEYDDDTESRIDEEENVSTGCETPRSSHSSYSVISHRPEKLRLEKPMEGSLALLQWQRLAIPSLGGILESREGIQVKGDDPHSHFEQETHSLSDCEEDDDCATSTGTKPRTFVRNRPKNSTDELSASDDAESSQNSRKFRRKSRKSKHAEEKERFILINATRVPLTTIVGLDDSTSDHWSRLNKRTRCIIA